MNNFVDVNDADNIEALIEHALLLKKSPYDFENLGKRKTIGLIFMNPSLRTRLSTQKAAINLGMNVMMMNFSGEGWALETEQGVIMNGDKPEHIKEAAAVVGSYCDIVAIRTFAGLKDKDDDYNELILRQFIRYCGKPIINMESATVHPLQSLTDLITIKENKEAKNPKILLTWAPHPKVLPQAVANSFAQWTLAAGYDLTIACPKGYELSTDFAKGAKVVHKPEEGYMDADFVYAKNWSSFVHYGKKLSEDKSWMVDAEKMKLTNNAKFMHCLPVRRNVVVEDSVIDSVNSLVIQQASNRVWAAQAVLSKLLENL
ncbi:MAG TPA: N-acetylornithine carbamoyltransferase [Cytophagales bacterium]|jgi:N-succinyl-L-ornithine transcarbamylase|nr:N-acetylornithine carbamoyltransferase [Cytophagales bacterium]